ncbi:OsmC family protein [Williamsia maris]|uniref:OsmC family protein n=1 Tax=Williamsia maris TaxID=72806 RepID=UPI003557D3B6
MTWTGNQGAGTANYRGYSRDHTVESENTEAVLGSADASFRGDATRWNPEQLFLASIANCHMLWYLHLAVRAGVVVTNYRDKPTATMREDTDGGGEFTLVALHPHVTISGSSDVDVAAKLHGDVAQFCFIARSVRVPIEHHPVIEVALH